MIMNVVDEVKKAINNGAMEIKVSPKNYIEVVKELTHQDNGNYHGWHISNTKVVVDKGMSDDNIIYE